MRKYEITFKVDRIVLKWERFYNVNHNEAEKFFKQVIEDEYYGKKIKYLNFQTI